MKNIQIRKVRDNYYTVVADTERFGAQEIVFEGISFDECAAWVKANVKAQKKALWAVETIGDATKAVCWVCVRSNDRHTAFDRVWRMGYNNGYRFGKEIAIA